MRWAFGPFVLDLERGQLLRDGAVQVVTPQARRLLEVLVGSPGRLLRKDELLARAWPDVVVGEAALSVCVAELRRVLGDAARAPRFIETAHREGYRFIAAVAGVADAQLRASPLAADVPALAVLPIRSARASRLDLDLAAGLREELVERALCWRQLPIAAPEGEDPGTARYRLDVHLQREGRRLRASARVADRERGHVIWAQRVDGPLDDPLDAQSALARAIVQSLRTGFAVGVEAGLAEDEGLHPWEAQARAQALRLRGSPAAAARGRRLLERAVARAPHAAPFRASLGSLLFDQAWNGWSEEGPALERGLLACAESAVALDPYAEALALQALALALRGRPQRAREAAARACALDPGEPRALAVHGFLQVLYGDPEDALATLAAARALGTHDAAYRFAAWTSTALALFAAGRDREVVAVARRARAFAPRWELDGILAAALARLGLRAAATSALARLRVAERSTPRLGAGLAATRPGFLAEWLEALRTLDRGVLPALS